MIDAQSIIASTDIVEVIGRSVDLKRSGAEYQGLCPFHSERSPSFTVIPVKQFFHCFGCGASGDVIAFVRQHFSLDFIAACEYLGAAPADRPMPRRAQAALPPVPTGSAWAVVMPVPESAPAIHAGIEVALWNPKRDRDWRCRPRRADAYRDAAGRLLGYVLRVDFSDGQKVTPQVTWCIGADGRERWCVHPFPKLRPLCGLDDLAAKPDAPVLVVEGEKCRAAGAAALSPYAVMTWPGGSKGVRWVDFSPLAGRDVVLWPDADDAGRDAMLGYIHYNGLLVDGVAQLAYRAGCRSLRFIDPAGQPKGWDIADALQVDGWTPRQLAAWAAHRVKDVEVAVDPQRKVA